MADEQLELASLTAGVPVTLLVNGSIITGITTTAGTFLRTSAFVVESDARERGVDGGQAQQVGDTFRQRAEELDQVLNHLQVQANDEDDEIDDDELGEALGYIHLASVQIVQGSYGFELPAGRVLRVAAERVQAFMWGRFQVQTSPNGGPPPMVPTEMHSAQPPGDD